MRKIDGLAGFAFTSYSPESLASFMKVHNLTTLDYWPWNKGESGVKSFYEMLNEQGISVSTVNVPGSRARVGDPHAEFSVFQEAVYEALALQAPYLQVYCAAPKGDDPNTAVLSLARDLEPIVNFAKDQGVAVILENNLDQRGEDTRGLSPVRTAFGLVELLDRFQPEDVNICFDPANFLTTREYDAVAAYKNLKPWIQHIHVKDCLPYSEAEHANLPAAKKLLVDVVGGEYLPAPVGQGAVQWRELKQHLSDDHFSGPIILDPFIHDALLEGWCQLSIDGWNAMEANS